MAAFSYVTWETTKSPGDTISITYPYLKPEHVVLLDADGVAINSSLYQWTSAGTIECLAGFPTGAGRAERQTPRTGLPSEQQGAGSFNWTGANQNDKTLLYIQQEVDDGEAARQAVTDELVAGYSEVLTAADTATAAANTATTKAGEASTSATNAASSAGAASTSAGSASSSASNAASSASTATTKASEAATSASASAGSASTATTKASEAATSASTATGAASTATTKADAASDSAAAASSSASTATTKADEAAASAAQIDLPSAPTALNYLRRNAANDGYENRTPQQVRGDIGQTWEQIGAKVDLTSAADEISWNNLVDYRDWWLFGRVFPSVDGENLRGQLSVDNGASWLNTNYGWQYLYARATTTTANDSTGFGASAFAFNPTGVGSGSNEGITLDIKATDFNRSAVSMLTCRTPYLDTSNNLVEVGSTQAVQNASIKSALRLYWGSGDFAAGSHLTLMGIRG